MGILPVPAVAQALVPSDDWDLACVLLPGACHAEWLWFRPSLLCCSVACRGQGSTAGFPACFLNWDNRLESLSYSRPFAETAELVIPSKCGIVLKGICPLFPIRKSISIFVNCAGVTLESGSIKIIPRSGPGICATSCSTRHVPTWSPPAAPRSSALRRC